MTVDAAYSEVQRLTRKRARNFAYGIMVLPREKRRAIAAIYAYARRVDDICRQRQRLDTRDEWPRPPGIEPADPEDVVEQP